MNDAVVQHEQAVAHLEGVGVHKVRVGLALEDGVHLARVLPRLALVLFLECLAAHWPLNTSAKQDVTHSRPAAEGVGPRQCLRVGQVVCVVEQQGASLLLLCQPNAVVHQLDLRG